MKSKKIIALAKGVWAFCSYLFIPQRRPKIKPILEFWYMEVPSCTEWALNTAMNRFQPNTWVEVGKEGVEAKVKALGMYRGVMRPYLHPRVQRLLWALLLIRDARLDVCMRRRLRLFCADIDYEDYTSDTG